MACSRPVAALITAQDPSPCPIERKTGPYKEPFLVYLRLDGV